MWYLDLGASLHMTRCRDFFSDLDEKYLQMHIELWDDGRYIMTGIGIVTFQRELSSHHNLKDAMFFPDLKKNLISLAVLEDRGYDAIFSKGKAFLRHIAMGQLKQIEVRVMKLYKLDVEDFFALSTMVKKLQGCDVGELWHIRLGHLHRGTLKIMKQITIGLPKGELK